MNRDFDVPLVISAQGGADGGGSRLTETAENIRNIYRDLCKRSLAQNKELLAKLCRPNSGD
jgi:molybdate transport system regulatory protein